MPNLLPRLLPLLALLGLLAGSSGWLEGFSKAIAENGMSVDPNGGNGPGGAPVTIIDPTDPGL